MAKDMRTQLTAQKTIPRAKVFDFPIYSTCSKPKNFLHMKCSLIWPHQSLSRIGNGLNVWYQSNSSSMYGKCASGEDCSRRTCRILACLLPTCLCRRACNVYNQLEGRQLVVCSQLELLAILSLPCLLVLNCKQGGSLPCQNKKDSGNLLDSSRGECGRCAWVHCDVKKNYFEHMFNSH